MILPTAAGGRHSRVFLKQFLHQGEILGVERLYSTSKEYHGAPIASIRLAFAALTRPRSSLWILTFDTCLKRCDNYISVTSAFPLNKFPYAPCIDRMHRQSQSTSWKTRAMMNWGGLTRRPSVTLRMIGTSQIERLLSSSLRI